LGAPEPICEAIRETVRLVKDGGKVVYGYNHDRVFPRDSVKECIKGIAKVEVNTDQHYFPEMAPYAASKSYTIVLTKGKV